MPKQTAVGPDMVISALRSDLSRLCSVIGERALVQESEGAALVVSGVAAPTLNCVFTTRRDARATEVDVLLGVIAERGLPYCLQLRPGVDPELDAIALDREMQPEDPIPLMVLERRNASLDRVAAHPSLEIRQLAADECDIHASIAASGFEAPVELFEQLIPAALLTHPGVRCYVGTVDQRPVTTALGFAGADHVGIFNVATLSDQRGHGYGQAITAQAIRDGFRSGASFAYLQSSDAGFNVYESLGFRTLENWALWTYSEEE